MNTISRNPMLFSQITRDSVLQNYVVQLSTHKDTLFHADCIRGVTAVLVYEFGEMNYGESEDAQTDWHIRRDTVAGIASELFFCTTIRLSAWDKDGFIPFDYEDEADTEANATETTKIFIDDNKTFIKSLAEAGIITVYGREGCHSDVFYENQRCTDCGKNADNICKVYHFNLNPQTVEAGHILALAQQCDSFVPICDEPSHKFVNLVDEEFALLEAEILALVGVTIT